jgi:hypothetical protein
MPIRNAIWVSRVTEEMLQEIFATYRSVDRSAVASQVQVVDTKIDSPLAAAI